MSETKKYYWLKLKKDFFKNHKITIVESMENGKDYILFYLKLLVESLDHQGSLRFSDSIPYNESMLASLTHTNVDIVRSAMKIFVELELIEILDDKTIFMNEVEKMIGSESEWAQKKRDYRLSQKEVPCLIEDKEEEKDDEKQLEEDFSKIYAIYPVKKGKTKAFHNYKTWVQKSGRTVNGRKVHLTNAQIWQAVKNYVDEREREGTEIQYYKHFDTLMGNQLLDYVEEVNNESQKSE